MPVTLWDYINEQMDGNLKDLLREWHYVEGVGTPTIATRLNEMGYEVEQRTVWRWLKQQKISKKGEKK